MLKLNACRCSHFSTNQSSKRSINESICRHVHSKFLCITQIQLAQTANLPDPSIKGLTYFTIVVELSLCQDITSRKTMIIFLYAVSTWLFSKATPCHLVWLVGNLPSENIKISSQVNASPIEQSRQFGRKK